MPLINMSFIESRPIVDVSLFYINKRYPSVCRCIKGPLIITSGTFTEYKNKLKTFCCRPIIISYLFSIINRDKPP